ncbi:MULTISPECIES: hypothetical protein [unclassified Methylobacterium]|uniref:hypothetical protein n=1 Tax=unclassified Methylobacterium TaxID=2615210 RepID=UPI0006FEDBBE|nr:MULTISPECIES: hypothetical protein [unclassified Methylobacterium]KQP58198.1 hypothetical protein ASF39_18580 [Methylobacterium sp. Leaf108]KQT87221.1 hypothetical protein ASG59_16585 [Methylobacterium sp. Leaf466]
MSHAARTSRSLSYAILAAALLGGCQALGGGGGVMPVSEVGPPPSMRSALPDRTARAAEVDPDGVPLQTRPTRQIALPKTAAGAGGRTAAQERRINREEIDVTDETRSSSGGLAPQINPGGGVGLGGKF